ncbi:tyrosine-type recombinase/integrase [Orbus sturtevantii]|uniref:tyrosine-type recombinase/integrase n=1 Tax=Orbus sturtevantii TaxID=3074109 RepID=UPI00370D21E2
MALSDALVKHCKPKLKAYTLKDIEGLALFVSPSGSKSWHFRFTLGGKRQRISLGLYPDIGLAEARLCCQSNRALVKQGVSPVSTETNSLVLAAMPLGANVPTSSDASVASDNKPIPVVCSSVESFAAFSVRWKLFKFRKLGLDKTDKRQSTAVQIERYLRKDMLPVLGELPMDRIGKADVLKVLRGIEARGALSIAEKCRGWLFELFQHAQAEGLIGCNPAAEMAVLALPKHPTQHNPFLRQEDLPAFLIKLAAYQGAIQTKLGIYLLLLTGVRTGELRQATPAQFDLEKGLWCIPAEQVKQLQRSVRHNGGIPPYVVPLSKQAISVVKELLSLMYPWQPFLLCHRSYPKLPISENTLNCGLKRLGYDGRLTGHGIRATLSTALNELDYPKQWIEAQLSHSDKDQIRSSYNHAQYIEQRRKMMQDWADRLDEWQRVGFAQVQGKAS